MFLFSNFGVFAEEVVAGFLAVNAAEESFHFDFTLELHKSVEHSLGTRRAPGDIYIDRHNSVDTFNDVIRFAERTT